VSERRGVLFVNPRSGGNGENDLDELRAAAERAGAEVRVLREGDDLEGLARHTHADVLGMAGGDGSLGVVAQAAIERDLPFVVVPWGTRNHFANDVGIDRDDPLRAVAAFESGVERLVDVGRVAERVFLNNVSFGIYARLVHRRERKRQRGESLARLRALLVSLRDRRRTERFVLDGEPVRASVLLIANNEYRLDLFSIGERERLDAGTLAVYAARGLRRLRWTERLAPSVTLESRKPVARAAVDGEPVRLETPLELRIEPLALRLLLPPEADGADGVEGAKEE
jgi:diacylglycerol kinase family enzyme